MVSSKDKGARAETAVRDVLRSLTGLKWERVPLSGAMDPKFGLKGDLFVAGANNLYCVEVKHYAEDQLTSSILSSKSPIFIQWWEQTIRESGQVGKTPMLIFKYDRSKLFVAVDRFPESDISHMTVSSGKHTIFIMLLEDYVKNENPKFIQ